MKDCNIQPHHVSNWTLSPINLVYHHTLYHILPSISKETNFPPFPDNHPSLTWAKWQYCCLPRQIRTLRIGRGADNVSKCDTNWRHPLLLKNREQIEKEQLVGLKCVNVQSNKIRLESEWCQEVSSEKVDLGCCWISTSPLLHLGPGAHPPPHTSCSLSQISTPEITNSKDVFHPS